MKVGVFLFDYPPDAGGGYTFQTDILRALADQVSESRHEFTLYCKHPENLDYLRESIQLRIAPALRNHPWSDAEGQKPALPQPHGRMRGRLARAFRKPATLPPSDPRPRGRFGDEFQAAGMEFLWFLSPLGLPVDIPYMTIVWDLQHRLQPWFPEVSHGNEWEGRESSLDTFLRRASIIIAGTEAGQEEIARFYQIPETRIRILPHPAPSLPTDPTTEPAQDTLAKYNLSPGYLFYPAQFWAHKNHVNLLLAVHKLREDYGLTFPVVFVGSDKGNVNYVKKWVEDLGLDRQVHFLGFVPQADLIALYRNAFALTYLTFFGPENLPPLEAFALKCPVIASDVSGAREQLRDAALLVDPADPAACAQAIKSLHDDSQLRNALIERGLNRASGWTGRDFVRGVFSIFDEFEAIRRCWGS